MEDKRLPLAQVVDKSRLERIAKIWSKYLNCPLASQGVLDMLHLADIEQGLATKENPPDHWVVEMFWDTVNEIGLDKLNHSPDSKMIAINLRQVKEACWAHGLAEPPYSTLLTHLKKSQRYAGPHRNIMSKITGSKKRCWVFKT
ncbi:MAG: hypothetical protein JEY79_11215 [Pseudodesulfovibrio sp.]|nr:hypothetical protein [Pseudodesulfovibrio sp.]